MVIAKLDATANEVNVPGVTAQGFPTIFWWRGDSKQQVPVVYEGGRELEALVDFVHQHAMNDVHADKGDVDGIEVVAEGEVGVDGDAHVNANTNADEL